MTISCFADPTNEYEIVEHRRDVTLMMRGKRATFEILIDKDNINDIATKLIEIANELRRIGGNK